MGNLRFLAALWAAKLSIVALKITRHNGTNFPACWRSGYARIL
ncbi:MAG: hypothetical protein V8R14_05665 [Clostridia bacterium]